MTMSVKKDIFLNKAKVAIFSDLHLGVHLDSPVWHQVAINWCDWFIEQLNEHNIRDVIFLGDFYHHRSDVSVSTLHVASIILDKLKSFNMIMVVGNHDSFYKQRSDINSLSILGGRENLTVISETTVTNLFGRTCTFLPWSADISALTESDIIFGHLEIESFKMNTFKTCDHGMKTRDLLSKSNLIMSGHFHLRDERKYTEGSIIYVGSPFEMDFGDVGSTKGLYILDFNTLDYIFIENKISPKHKKISLTELTNTKSITGKEINQIVNGNFVKLIIDKKANNDAIDTLIQKFSAYNPLSFITDYTHTENTYNIDDKNYENTGVDMQATIHEFINILDIDNKENIIQYCTDLYKRACEI